MAETRLKRPLMLVAGVLAIASLLLPLWTLTMTAPLEYEGEDVGNAEFVLNAGHFDVNLSMSFTVEDDNATELTESVSINYADLNYTENAEDWLFPDSENVTVLPADAVTQYIYPVTLAFTFISGIMMLGIAFMTPKRWLLWLMVIFIIVAILYFWYAWDLFLSHLQLKFLMEDGALMELPTGSVVSGNPALGYILMIGSAILMFLSIYRTRKELFPET